MASITNAGQGAFLTVRDVHKHYATVRAVDGLSFEVQPGEILATLALTLPLATAWVFRRAAGAIFGLGVLMYGKEPTLRELLRWARQI